MQDNHLSRRRFTALAAAYAARPTGAQSARTSVAEMERVRVLAEALAALPSPMVTLDTVPALNAGANEFVSNAEPDQPLRSGDAKPFRAHAVALRNFSAAVACLTAAYVLTQDERFARRAGEHLRAWLVAPATRMSPQPERAGCRSGTATQTTDCVLDLIPVAELARATSFLVDSQALSPESFEAMNAWFTDLLEWLNTARQPVIARDTKDHRASAWLLITAALARSQREERLLDACRHRLRTPTLRNQLTADGRFPQELATANPYRNSLWNFDLLCGACALLDSPFDKLWTYELMDGPGMRSAAAFLYPVIRDRAKWPFVADVQSFRELPGRRAGLLFAGRAFDRPEYVELWRSLPADVPEDLAGTFPVRQPLLWTTRAAHGL